MLSGSCLCGKVRYEIIGAPQVMYHCHCGICRKATGTSFATNVFVPADEFRIVSGRESLTAYESSPNKHRHFCSACGSPIYSQAEATKHVVSVRCGTLDVDPGLRPTVHVYVGSKAPWTQILDDVAQMPGSVG